MRRRPLLLLIPAAALVLVLALAGIATAAGHSSARKAASKQAVVTTRKTKLGTILVNGQGRSLYLFEKDKGTASTCYGACASVWPPLTTGANAKASGLRGARLGTTRRKDGKTEVTVAGHPLYTYAGDQRAGDVKGQGLDQFGAEWYVLGANGHKIEDGS